MYKLGTFIMLNKELKQTPRIEFKLNTSNIFLRITHFYCITSYLQLKGYVIVIVTLLS